MKKNHYVYEIINLLDGRKYIGVRSCDCEPADDSYWSSSKYVLEDIRNLGRHLFRKRVLQTFSTRVEAVAAEVSLHALLKVDEDGMYYNRSKQKTSKFDTSSLVGDLNHFFGKTHSAETKLKLSQALKGKPGPRKGVSWSDEQREHIRRTRLGSKATEETREKMRQAKLGVRVGEKHPMFGKHHTEEAKQRIKKSLKGVPKPESWKQKLKERMATDHPMKGKTHTPEARMKIAEASRKRHAARRAKTFESTGTLGSAGGSATAVRTSDA